VVLADLVHALEREAAVKGTGRRPAAEAQDLCSEGDSVLRSEVIVWSEICGAAMLLGTSVHASSEPDVEGRKSRPCMHCKLSQV
jgi:hypothetical protein